jgi:hypothetical protein
MVGNEREQWEFEGNDRGLGRSLTLGPIIYHA